jgi:hypothetical protein
MGMGFLLVARINERQQKPYLRLQLFGTVIRHAQALAIATLCVSMVEPPLRALLVPSPGGPFRDGASQLATAVRAVSVAAITATAQKEHLATIGPGADDEAE